MAKRILAVLLGLGLVGCGSSSSDYGTPATSGGSGGSGTGGTATGGVGNGGTGGLDGSYMLTVTEASVDGDPEDVNQFPAQRLDLRTLDGVLEAALTQPLFDIAYAAKLAKLTATELLVEGDFASTVFGTGVTLHIALDEAGLPQTFTATGTVTVPGDDTGLPAPFVASGNVVRDHVSPVLSIEPDPIDGPSPADGGAVPWGEVSLEASEHIVIASLAAPNIELRSASGENVGVEWTVSNFSWQDGPDWVGRSRAVGRPLDWLPLVGSNLVLKTGAVLDPAGNAALESSASFPIRELGPATTAVEFDAVTDSVGNVAFLGGEDERCEGTACAWIGPKTISGCIESTDYVLGLLDTSGGTRVSVRYRLYGAKAGILTAIDKWKQLPVVALVELQVPGHGELESAAAPLDSDFSAVTPVGELGLATEWITTSIDLPAGTERVGYLVKLGADTAACKLPGADTANTSFALAVDSITVE